MDWEMAMKIGSTIKKLFGTATILGGVFALLLIDIVIGAVGWKMNLPFIQEANSGLLGWMFFMSVSVATSAVNLVFWEVAVYMFRSLPSQLRGSEYYTTAATTIIVALAAIAVGVADIIIDLSPVQVWMGISTDPGISWQGGGLMYRAVLVLLALLSGANEPLLSLLTDFFVSSATERSKTPRRAKSASRPSSKTGKAPIGQHTTSQPRRPQAKGGATSIPVMPNMWKDK